MVVSDACLKRITSFLASDPRFDHTRRALAEQTNLGLDESAAGLTTFATYLLWLNEYEYAAAYAAYGEKVTGRVVRMDVVWGVGDLEAFKAMQAWLCQLNDPGTHASPVVRIVDRATRDLAEMIIAALPGYDGLPWG